MSRSAAPSATISHRLAGLDLFRGLTVAFMILVNNPGTWGAIYPPLQHAKWHGCTPTDLVFPFFVFITGASMPWSLAKGREAGRTEWQLTMAHMKRCAAVFAVGLALNGFPYYDLATLRIPGVLQRIALASLVAGVFVRRGNARTWALAALGLLVLHTALLLGVKPPNSDGDLLARGGDVGAFIDRWLLGSQHMWSGGRGSYDPEGLLGTLSSAATVLLGAIAGDAIRRNGINAGVMIRSVAIGALLAMTGITVGPLIPINKALWTATFVMVTGGLAFIGLVGAVLIADLLQLQGGPVRVGIAFGRNPLFLFVLAGVLGRLLTVFHIGGKTAKDFIFQSVFVPLGSTSFASMMYAATMVLLFAGLAVVLDRRGIRMRF